MTETISVPMLYGALGLIFTVFGTLCVLAFRSASKAGRSDWIAMFLAGPRRANNSLERVGFLIAGVGILCLAAAVIDAFNLYPLFSWLY